MFSGTDAASKTYDFHLNVTGFSFSSTVNSVFAPNADLVAAVPRIELGEGSRVDITDSGPQSPSSQIELNKSSPIDASALVDLDAFSSFWQDLCFNQADRNVHHEVIGLASSQDTAQKLTKWEEYVKANQGDIKSNVASDPSLLADFVADNIDLTLKDEYAWKHDDPGQDNTKLPQDFMFDTANTDDLKQAIADTDTVITFPTTATSTSGDEAFAFGSNGSASNPSNSSWQGLTDGGN